MSVLQPRDDRFFRLLEDGASNMERGADMLVAMLDNYADVAAQAKAIKQVEHTGDDLTHETYDQLNRIFVTPFDREDISAITSAVDDVLDLVEAAADDFVLFAVEAPLPPAAEMARIIQRSASEVRESIGCLRQLRRQRDALRDRLKEINRLENDGDAVYRAAIEALFRERDPILIIKWKQIYDHLERAIDACEDVADVLYDVILKYG